MKLYRVVIKRRDTDRIEAVKIWQKKQSATNCAGYWAAAGRRWGHAGEPFYDVTIEVATVDDWQPMNLELERLEAAIGNIDDGSLTNATQTLQRLLDKVLERDKDRAALADIKQRYEAGLVSATEIRGMPGVMYMGNGEVQFVPVTR